MSQQIIIEGDLVRLVSITTERSISLADWLPSIERRPAVYTPVLPRATRALWFDPSDQTNQKMVVLMEVEPQVVSLNKQGTIHRVMMPWTRFVFYCTNNPGINNAERWRLEDYRVFWSKNRYTDPAAEDSIRALLPNVYDDGRICFGSTGVNAEQSIADRLDQTVNEFYASTFNNDLSISYPNNWRGFRAWATATARDHMGWMQWPDLQPENYSWAHYSWNRIITDWANESVTRHDPVMTPDGIPPLHLGASFGRVTEWLNALTPMQRSRIRLATDQIPEDAFGNILDDEDENTEEDEDGEM